MPGCGDICFYTETELPEPEQAVLRVLQYCGAEWVSHAFRTLEPDRGWEAFQESLAAPFVAVQVVEDDVPTEDFLERMTVEEAANLYSPSGTTHLIVGRNQLSTVIYDEVKNSIPVHVAGHFVPSDPSIRIGWHDLFEWNEHEEGYFFGRAFFSFSLFGNDTPNEWETYRKLILEVPAVRKLKADLEAIVGPLQQCACWDI